MLRLLTEALDHLAIWTACRSIAPEPTGASHLKEALALVSSPDFLMRKQRTVPELQFEGGHSFSFDSTVCSPWAENNQVRGRLYKAGVDWQSKPSVILLHGWNGETGYYGQFPYLAWRLNRAGLNAAMIELPYHGQRRPRRRGATGNFLSHDFLRNAEAVQQSIADTRSVMRWLEEQGSQRVGVWGFSLGAWLTGLLAASEPHLAFAVLLTPVVRMDRAFAELRFFEPIRRSLQMMSIDFFNLISHQPVISARQVLIVKSEFDLFAPSETVEEFWEAWGRPEIWRTRHGHISVLLSLAILERVVKWCSLRATGDQA